MLSVFSKAYLDWSQSKLQEPEPQDRLTTIQWSAARLPWRDKALRNRLIDIANVRPAWEDRPDRNTVEGMALEAFYRRDSPKYWPAVIRNIRRNTQWLDDWDVKLMRIGGFSHAQQHEILRRVQARILAKQTEAEIVEYENSQETTSTNGQTKGI